MQNVYDDPEFFAGYRALREGGRGLHETTIRPALPRLLPELRGRRVVDLGCGGGWLARLAAEGGAASVLGLDPSERMLALARERTADARIRYRRAFAEEAEVAAGSVDVVLSVLALHYVADLPVLFERIAGWLAGGGELLAVLEHPLFLAPVPDRGFAETPAGRRAYLLHSYAIEGERNEHWFVPGVRKYHRTLASIVNALAAAGLRLDRLEEPLPDPALADAAELAEATACPVPLALRASKPPGPDGEARADASRFPSALHLADGDLVLRAWQEDDLELVRAAGADPYVVRIAHLPEPPADATARGWIAARRTAMERGESAELVVALAGRAVGAVSLTRRHPPGAAEPGCWLVPDARGRGTAGRATRLLCRWALDALGIARLQATVEPWNVASRRTLERAGFRREGVLRGYASYGGERQDVLLYARLAGDDEPPESGR